MLRLVSASMLLITVVIGGSRDGLAAPLDNSVTTIRLPGEDVTFIALESRNGNTVRLETATSSMEGRRVYIGDGDFAVEIRIDPLKGPMFQGAELRSGHVFKKDATIKLHPGYKKASDLRPGSVYVILSGVTFDASKPTALSLEDLLR